MFTAPGLLRSTTVLPLAVLVACAAEQGSLTNRMEHGLTGYLSRAAKQPVRWQPWGAEAFALAAELDRPVLLVIGAEGCTPCVEMDRLWADPSLASLVNTLFVPVRVDRDERPDVARRYQAVVRTLAGIGGYPLTVFLTADGSAFFGGTTFPVDDPLTGRGLRQVLPEAARAYREQRAAVRRQAAAAQQLAIRSRSVTHGLVGPAALTAGVAAVRDALADWHGEMAASATTIARAAALLFAWFAETGDSAFLGLARETVESLAADQRATDGREPAALSRAAVLRALVRGWVVTGDSGLHHTAIHALADLRGDLSPAAEELAFTDVTAYVIAAALEAGPVLGDEASTALAVAALDSLLRRVYASQLGARHATVGSVRGLLQDQVQLAAACLAAYGATGTDRYLDIARELAGVIERDYADPLGGYFDTAESEAPAPALAERTKQVLDDALPGANASVTRVFLDLAAALGDDTYRRRADATLEALAAVAQDGGMWAAAYLDAARVAVARR